MHDCAFVFINVTVVYSWLVVVRLGIAINVLKNWLVPDGYYFFLNGIYHWQIVIYNAPIKLDCLF